VQTGVPNSGVRLGVLGGTFDPIHVGHLALAAAAAESLDLHKVVFVVANNPWQKAGRNDVSPAADRLAMVRAAVPDDPRFEVSDIEIRRGGDSYTAETLAELSSVHPGSEIFLIIGSDLLAELDTWHQPQRVREMAQLAVVRRPGSLDAVPPAGWRFTEIESPPIELSSSDLRAALAAGRGVEFLVPAGARKLIDERGLYRSSLGGS